MEKNVNNVPSNGTSLEEILNDNDLLASQKLFRDIFGAIAGISAVINRDREILYANDPFLEFLGVTTLDAILGKRAGEVISCAHAGEGPSGCGSSDACKYCGTVNAIYESQKTNFKTVKETSISSVVDGHRKSWDLKVTSTPVTLANEQYYLLSLQDISFEKRLAALERIFFHDLLNIASGLNGLLTIIQSSTDPEEKIQLISQSEEASRDIIEEIMMYRQLRAAEEGDIQVKPVPVKSLSFLESAIALISSHEVAQYKNIQIAENSYDNEIITDRILLQRIIINMLKNALEATGHGSSVRAGIENRGALIRFWVWNEMIIPRDVQEQIFNRSFSTKGKGRGLGTYSMRLLAENYLKSTTGFISNEHGTIFFADVPRVLA